MVANLILSHQTHQISHQNFSATITQHIFDQPLFFLKFIKNKTCNHITNPNIKYFQSHFKATSNTHEKIPQRDPN